MRPVASAIRRGNPDVEVALLRYGSRGWNGPAADPVVDTIAAIQALARRRPGVPIILVGHSMGGRAALRCAGRAEVRGVVVLAPWLPPGDPWNQLAGRDLAIVHGTRDRTTSAPASAALARRAASIARTVSCVHLAGGDHGMLRRASTWHRLTAAFVAAMAAGTDPRRVLPEGAASPADCVTV
jgi:alpha-beta hydrolase superfamily lysophospholipase